MEKGKYVPGYGSNAAKLAVIGEAPGAEEEESGIPFYGKAGKVTKTMLKEAGVDPENDIYYSNIEKYRPPGNKISRFKEIGKRPFEDMEILWDELKDRGINCILAVGQHALKGLTGKPSIKLWRGSILTTLRHNIKCVATYHTSNLVRAESESEETGIFDVSARAYMQLDFNRAVEESQYHDLILPIHQIEICQSASHLKDFLKKYEGLHRISMDIETARGASIPICLGLAFNKDHGMCVPLLPFKDWEMDDPTRRDILKILQEVFLDPKLEVIGQNFKFDMKRLIKSYGFKINPNIYFDVGMCAHILYPEFPKKLEFLTSVWTREPYYKDELKEFDSAKDSIEDVFRYNVKDVCIPYEIHDKMLIELEERNLTEFFFDEVMPLHEFYMTMEMNGLSYNHTIMSELRSKYLLMKKELASKLDELIGYKVNMKSWPQVHKLLYTDLKLPWRDNTQEDTLVALLANHTKPGDKKHEVLNGILDIRKINRTLDGPLNAKPDYDGKMRTLFNINGAANGRTSCNILKPPERPTQVGIQGQNLTKHGTLGADLRKIIIPSRGKVLLSADKRQAEAYVVAALSRDPWMMRILQEQKDLHSITASWLFDKENKDDPENPEGISKDERFVGKTGRHMLHYRGGEVRLMREINTKARTFNIPVNVSQSDCRMYRKIFFSKSPYLEEVFFPEIERVIRDCKTLKAASGRERIFFGFWDPNLYYSYIPSTSVTDDTKFAGVRIHKRLPWLPFLLEGHDSLLVECDPVEVSDVRGIMEEEMEKPMRLDQCSLPRDPISIPCDFEIGDNYKDMERLA
jgi:uracil-DNA glycosylase family 4